MALEREPVSSVLVLLRGHLPYPLAPERQLAAEPLGIWHQTWPTSCLFLVTALWSPWEASISEVGTLRPHTSWVVLWSDTQHRFWMDREVWVRVESPLTPWHRLREHRPDSVEKQEGAASHTRVGFLCLRQAAFKLDSEAWGVAVRGVDGWL